ncbi:MAG TPA: hypothetical protein VFL14_16395 [Xanthomonadales bacterium]|nr:hypothetical protein [Xanthomonadales bacterium]
MWKFLLLMFVALPTLAATNPNRAYPPSCLEFPLAATPTGPSQFTDFTAIGATTGATEPARAIFWRAPCSGGNGAFLVTIQRLAPRDPAIQLPQAFVSNDGGIGEIAVRLVVEPNTFAESHVLQSSTSQTYVVEFGATGSRIDLDTAFNLRAFYGGAVVISGLINAYDPAAYPEASQPIPIAGRLTGSWYDPAHAGEGIFLEVGENAGGRFVFFAWFTYDQTGRPYWLVGQASVPAGARSVTIPTQYYANGGFAGNFATATGAPWGTVTMTFPSCNALTLGFQSGSVPAGIPSGSGTRNWVRLVNIDGYSCE